MVAGIDCCSSEAFFFLPIISHLAVTGGLSNSQSVLEGLCEYSEVILDGSQCRKPKKHLT